MGYSNKSDHVRVDFFKPSGRWYTTEEVVWTGGYDDCLIQDAFVKSLRNHFAKDVITVGGVTHQRLSGMTAVCLEPYHVNAHPIMTIWKG
jgi:hypothetical protein